MSRNTKQFIEVFSRYTLIAMAFILLGYLDDGKIIYLHLTMPFVLTPWTYLLSKKLKLFEEDKPMNNNGLTITWIIIIIMWMIILFS
ncbi:hypothetical protein CON39_11780 [Bacillus thuringiensis]|uniref:hypothetical protein n=1 Tax=Bacillus thuringiensis TaxID=1428 RepID=UPI000BED198B|nr:hypothetical protein [Bacillus thuringiensis]PEF30345.1 hypothetical protein CON39_11780 [Bacillus thuringiensis]